MNASPISMKINLSDQVLAEIGKIVVIFSLIEQSLSEIIGAIVTVGGRHRALGTVVTADLSFGQRVSTLNSLLLLALPSDHEAVAEFNMLRPILFDAEQKRNAVVHSVWGKSERAADEHTLVRWKVTAKSRRGLRQDF